MALVPGLLGLMGGFVLSDMALLLLGPSRSHSTVCQVVLAVAGGPRTTLCHVVGICCKVSDLKVG